MKTAFCFCLVFATLIPARAQIFRPGAVNGSLSSGTQNTPVSTPGRGGNINRDVPGGQRPGTGYGHVGSGRSSYGHRGYGFGYGSYGPRYTYGFFPSYYPSYGYYSGYGYDYPYYGTSGYYGSGSAAANGLLLGALAGGIIGNNSGSLYHNGWRGAAWGAGVGWLLGAVTDANRRPVVYDTAPVVFQQAASAVSAQSASPQPPQQITIINNYYNTPMSGANSLFGR